MQKNNIYIGNNEVNTAGLPVKGGFVKFGNEKFYRIQNYHEMPDFFISNVSDSDHWMFISSNGSLSAGRKDRDNALFPYYTVDKIHDSKGITGSRTYVQVEKDNKTFLWEPFTDNSPRFYRITRNIYKSIYGNKIIFEEINDDLGICFRYGWYFSEMFGFIKKSFVENLGESMLNVKVLDGIKNILPPGFNYGFQNEYSNLLDAYKKNERVENSSLGLFMLSSIPVDRAEPSEALMATTVWSVGTPKDSDILISDKQVNSFISGRPIEPEYDIRASRGAYFIHASLQLNGRENKTWHTIAEVNQDSTNVANLNHLIRNSRDLDDMLWKDVVQGTDNLKKRVASADGFQVTNTDICYARHYSNTLYNIMRGGVFVNNYRIETEDFRLFLSQTNKQVAEDMKSWASAIPDEIAYLDLIQLAMETGHADLIRIAYEYLPLTFSRRHGDPSRPWNLFSIETKTEDNSVRYNYQGNWRDIFQNWEALCYSFPEFTEGIISKFLNASTIDGYNPYRIMREGVDWEAPDPNDPWAYIGYWGDHQIIYLQKLLEVSNDFHPGKLDDLLTNEIFTYANVPYKIKPYSEIIRNPKDTVVFDEELNAKIRNESTQLGADASLLKNRSGDEIYRVNLTEKILVTLLSKLSNFIPEAGIWLNTQRPEWNDANNALVGNGTSMVTLYYLRRFLRFWEEKFIAISLTKVEVSGEVANLFENFHRFFAKHEHLLEKGFSDADRKYFADYLGQEHGNYRSGIYEQSFTGIKRDLSVKDLLSFVQLCLKFTDHSIQSNKRKDGLYHAYNLISINQDGISIRNLYEMLEGQVAILSSGYLTSLEGLEVLNALKKSKMYRADQYSYMLYPDRQLPRFMEKNTIPEKVVKESSLLRKLLEDNETSIIKIDQDGHHHFAGSFRNAENLKSALDKLLPGAYGPLVKKDKAYILSAFEDIFDHQSFTGRSGTFYGYEGLGSIYWHMVSKLLLATQECYFKAISEGIEFSIVGQLEEHYYEIKAGIGLYKTPDLYGAFPMDAYSHTPSKSGVKQPGLTGQVKEDVISRIGELGVFIQNGKINFEPVLLNKEEILDSMQTFEFYKTNGDYCQLELNENQIGFSLCQVPVIYTFSEGEKIDVSFENGSIEKIQGNSLDRQLSKLIFKRSGEVKQINVFFNSIHHVG